MTGREFSSFAELYAERFRPLWAYLVRLGATSSIAEDLAQEAFVRCWEHGRNEDRVMAKAFLFTTANRLLTDHWRKERRLVQWDDEFIAPEETGNHDRLLTAGAWTGLSLRERQLLWLAYAEEFSHNEIAAVAGLASGSVKVLLSRARAKLSRNLSDGERDGE